MTKSKIDIIYDMVNLAYDVKRQCGRDKTLNYYIGDYARDVIKAKDEKVYDEFIYLAKQLEAEGWEEFIDWSKNLIKEYNQIEESKKSMKESINGDCYIYYNDDDGKRNVFCDYVKGITDTRDWFYLNEYIIDAIHIFKNEKQAQKFIDEHLKYFADQDKVVIAEYPQTVSGFFESKESARKSIEESKTMTFEEFKKLCNDNFGYAIMDFNEYKGAYIVVVSSNEKATELFTKALTKKGLECTFYELKDPNSEYYRCYEIMCV